MFGSSAMLPGASGIGPVVDTTVPVASSASIVIVCWLVLKFCATQSTSNGSGNYVVWTKLYITPAACAAPDIPISVASPAAMMCFFIA